MGYKHFFLVCAILAWFCFADLRAQNGIVQIPRTRFTCQGRPSGYYADMETGCQVYHMCDGLGRQFSYTCPNTTLFQQRMLICDHWYMVNCSTSESDYDANLLIGQRDKPFVSDEEMRLRTPRPDILSVPPNSNYYDGLREAESKFPILPGNSIVGNTETISGGNNNGLDSDKQNYRPPSSWSTGTSVNNQFNNNRPTNSRPANNGKTRPSSNNQNSFINNQNVPPHQNFINNNQHKPFNPNSDNQLTIKDNLDSAASQEPSPTIAPTPNNNFDFTQNTGLPKVTPTPPSLELRPPAAPTTTTEVVYDIDIRMKEPEDDPIYQFIKRFDPNSPDSIKTSMTKTEILNINQQLPDGQSSGEDQRTPRKNKNTGNRFNSLSSETRNKGGAERTRFDSVNEKPTTFSTEPTDVESNANANRITQPEKILLPPKEDYSTIVSTTMGPPIYYEWKWAVPAFDLEPPKVGNSTNATEPNRDRTERNPFSAVTRTPTKDIEPEPHSKNTEYNISSYYVPDYVFPLDKPHPGYENAEAQTSFQVNVARPGRSSYGENPACPQCHPAYLEPGTCEPCIVKR